MQESGTPAKVPTALDTSFWIAACHAESEGYALKTDEVSISFAIVAHAVAYAAAEVAVMPSRQVKLFKNGRNQAVRIPRAFELPGEDAIMRKDGQRLIIEPAPPESLLAVLDTLTPLDEDFPRIPELTVDPVEL